MAIKINIPKIETKTSPDLDKAIDLPAKIPTFHG